jgi:putative hemolysin
MYLNHTSLFAAVAVALLLPACAAGASVPDAASERQNIALDIAPSDCAAAQGQCVAIVPGACNGGTTIAGACGNVVGSTCCVLRGDRCKPLTSQSSAPGRAGVSNPASVYASQMKFAPTAACSEWGFYRGECGQSQSFCVREGGTVANVVESRGSWTASYARCTLPTGKTCEEQSFAATCECK